MGPGVRQDDGGDRLTTPDARRSPRARRGGRWRRRRGVPSASDSSRDRLEFRRAAAIDQFWIDRLVAFELLQEIDWPEADALVLDIDERTVVSLDRIFRFQLDQLIR